MHSKEVIRKIYENHARGDFDAVMDDCTDDVCFIFPVADPQLVRYSGAAVGKDGFRQRTQHLHEDFEYLDFKVLEMVAEGDRVAARMEIHMRRRTTGTEFVMNAADFWTVKDGKAVELIEYYDTALAARVL